MATDVDRHDDDSPWTQRGFLVAAVLVGAIVIIGLVVAFTGGSTDEPSRPQGQAPPAVAPSPTKPASDSVCGLPAGDQETPTSGPEGTRWELVGSMAAPTAPGIHGPGKVASGFRTCFARSPIGALYAAVNFWASATDNPSARVYEVLAARTPERRQAIKDARRNPTSADDSGKMQVAGFNFVSYDQGAANVDLAFRLENGALLHAPTAMRWENGDWHYVIPSSGNPGFGRIEDLTNYAEWSGA